MWGGDFSFLLFYKFYNEMGKENADLKENLIVWIKSCTNDHKEQ